MIDLYTWTTPNGRKASIMLEELGLAYKVFPIDIGKGEQMTPAFLALNPNNRIPVIVDPDGPGGSPFTVFESGAILMYLADKTGRLMAKQGAARYVQLQWLMWQMGGFGPMLGQAHHFIRSAKEKIPYAIDRYKDEARRLYRVMDMRLAEAEYLGGEYSVADIAAYPWAARHEWHQVDLAGFANVKRWYDAIGARPAVQRGMKVPA
jgi:GSH-dependent disulfide-bond oxidoreductase